MSKQEIIETDIKVENVKQLNLDKNSDIVDYKSVANKLLQYVSMGDSISEIKKTVNYVVRIPVEYKKEFELGSVVLNENSKNGNIWPQLVRVAPNGKKTIVANLKIQKLESFNNNPIGDIALNANNIFVQQKLNEILNIVKKTSDAVKRIERGQHNDRVARILTGRKQLKQALAMKGEQKKKCISDARNNLMIGRDQILLELEERINSFDNIPSNRAKLWMKEIMHEGYFREKDNEFYDIQACYTLYIAATKLIAFSLVLEGEDDAVEDTFLESMDALECIDFDKMKCIENIHPNITNAFYQYPKDYIEVEKKQLSELARPYDVIEIKMSGKQILEAMNDGKI